MSVKKQTKYKNKNRTRTSNYTKYPGELPATNKLEQHKVPSRVQDNTDSKELHRVPLRAPEDKLTYQNYTEYPREFSEENGSGYNKTSQQGVTNKTLIKIRKPPPLPFKYIRRENKNGQLTRVNCSSY